MNDVIIPLIQQNQSKLNVKELKCAFKLISKLRADVDRSLELWYETLAVTCTYD